MTMALPRAGSGRRHDASLIERVSADALRARDPALFAEVDAFAPGLLDVFMSAIGGDVDALVKIGKVATCRDAHPTPE